MIVFDFQVKDRDETIVRGLYSFDIYMPAGAELYFCIYAQRQAILSVRPNSDGTLSPAGV
jgi:hypothetical protein